MEDVLSRTQLLYVLAEYSMLLVPDICANSVCVPLLVYQLLILVYNRTHIVRVSRYDTVDDIMVILEAELGILVDCAQVTYT
jgi:hypothetical protein